MATAARRVHGVEPHAAEHRLVGLEGHDGDARAAGGGGPRASSSAPAQRPHRLIGGQARAAPPAGHRRAHEHQVERRSSQEHVGVGRRVDAAVDVGLAVDHDRARRSRGWRTRPPPRPRHGAARRPGRTRPAGRPTWRTAQIQQRLRPARRRAAGAPMPSEIMSVLTEPSGSSGRRPTRVGRRGDGGRPAPGCAARSRRPGAPAAREGRSGGGARDRARPAARAACPRPTAAGPARRRAGRGPERPARSEAPGDRPGRRPDDDAAPSAGPSPSPRPGRREHAGVERPAGHAAGAEHQARPVQRRSPIAG